MICGGGGKGSSTTTKTPTGKASDFFAGAYRAYSGVFLMAAQIPMQHFPNARPAKALLRKLASIDDQIEKHEATRLGSAGVATGDVTAAATIAVACTAALGAAAIGVAKHYFRE